MKRTYLLLGLLLSFIASSCSPSETSIQTAIANTQIALPTSTTEPTKLPTSTPTMIPISEISFDEILFIDGDLPPSFIPGQIKYELPNVFELKGNPTSDKIVNLVIHNDNFLSEGVTVLIYESLPTLQEVFTSIAEKVGRLPDKFGEIETLSNLGENAFVAESDRDVLFGTKSVRLAFTRCNALVHINLFSQDTNKDTVESYAIRLDKRIEEIVCR